MFICIECACHWSPCHLQKHLYVICHTFAWHIIHLLIPSNKHLPTARNKDAPWSPQSIGACCKFSEENERDRKLPQQPGQAGLIENPITVLDTKAALGPWQELRMWRWEVSVCGEGCLPLPPASLWPPLRTAGQGCCCQLLPCSPASLWSCVTVQCLKSYLLRRAARAELRLPKYMCLRPGLQYLRMSLCLEEDL